MSLVAFHIFSVSFRAETEIVETNNVHFNWDAQKRIAKKANKLNLHDTKTKLKDGCAYV